jgi:hypothetical protein
MAETAALSAQLANQTNGQEQGQLTKAKSNKDAGQRTPGGVATRDPEASPDGTAP